LNTRRSTERNLNGLLIGTDWKAAPVDNGWRLEGVKPLDRSIYASLTKSWLTLHLPLDLQPAVSPRERFELYLKLLKLNERKLFLTKYSLDEKDQLLLSAEVPTAGSHLRLSRMAAEAVAVYGSRHLKALEGREPHGNGQVGAELELLNRKTSAPPVLLTEYFHDFIKSVEPDGWGPLEAAQGHSWHLGYKGHLRMFDVYFFLTKSWATFQVPVLIETKPPALSLDYRIRALFLRYLLRLNDELYMVKFGVDEDGQVLLMLELPLENLNFHLFLLAIRTISRYLETYTQELEIIASPERDRHIFDLLVQLDSAKYPTQRSN
jgi:hypothetical protein